MDLKNIQLYVFSGKGISPQERYLYEKCYDMWKSVWKKTFLELDGSDELYSDNFTRQDKIFALFHGATAIAVATLRICDFTLNNSMEDSIFSSWSQEAINILTIKGPRVLVCSNLAVHPDYRGAIAKGIMLKNLITYLSAKELIESDCDAMSGTARVNRGANKAAYANGAHLVSKSKMHGVEVDLVAFYKDELISKLKDEDSNLIWNNRIDFITNNTVRILKAA